MRRFEKFEKEDIMKNEKRPSEQKKAIYLLPTTAKENSPKKAHKSVLYSCETTELPKLQPN